MILTRARRTRAVVCRGIRESRRAPPCTYQLAAIAARGGLGETLSITELTPTALSPLSRFSDYPQTFQMMNLFLFYDFMSTVWFVGLSAQIDK